MSNVNFIKTIDNSSSLDNAIQLAIQPLASIAYVSSYVGTATQSLATISSVQTKIDASLVPYSTTTSTNTAITTALVPYSTTTATNTAITTALVPYSTTTATNTAINTAITSSSLLPLANTWTNTNTFQNINLQRTSNLVLPVGPSTYTVDLGTTITSAEIPKFIDSANNIVSIENTVIGTTYRIITLSIDASVVGNTIYYQLLNQTAGDEKVGVFLGPYNAISNTTNLGFVSYDVGLLRYKIWNYSFVMGASSVNLYAYGLLASTTGGIPYPDIPLTKYASITVFPPAIKITPTQLSYLSGGTSNIQSQISNVRTNLLSGTNAWSGSNIFTGVCNCIQSADTILPSTFTTTPSFSMTSGMVYNLTTSATALTSLSFTNIPTTPQQTYVFTFVLLPSTSNSPWYLKPPSNFINITPIGGTLISSPIYGISNVVFPTSYTYILQTVTIVNTSTTTSPNFVSFLSISAY